MKNFLTVIYFLSICVIFCSCSKDDTVITPGGIPDTSTNFKYPYTINSNWYFTKTPVYAFHPDSIRQYLTSIDSSIESGYAVWKNDTIINGVTARVLRTNHTSVIHAYSTVETYVQTDTGLVNLTFVPEVSFGPFRPAQMNASEMELIEGLFGNRDSAVHPVNCLKYPIVPNTEWYFRNLAVNQVQKKKYLGYVQTQVPAGAYNCIKIQRINYQNNVQDTNFVWYDYFSKDGLIKTSYKRMNLAAFYNDNIIGYYDSGFEIVLNLVEIKP